MTFGEKLKEARKDAGLTQEELAAKLSVSRQAITKWESGKGMPDVENLKAISAALDVSIDYLLDDGTQLDLTVIREPINLDDYEPRKGGPIRKVDARKEALVKMKFPDAEVRRLVAEQIKTKPEKVVDNALWLLTPLPPDMSELYHSFNNVDSYFFLITQGEERLLVLVTSDFMETRKITQPIEKNKFEMCGFKFKVGLILK